jgi:BirA family transcriptional regulator, biotin operon repressor / biotin---[acetyl-CoA-carboxylase] ligase
VAGQPGRDETPPATIDGGMTERPVLPPLLRPVAVSADLHPFERGLDLAAEGAEAGTLLWSSSQEVCEGAIVLAPEQPLEPSLPIVLIAMLGLGDALGAMVPPMVAVTFGWPDRIEVNGGVVGGVRFAAAATATAEAVPDWLVIGFGIAVRGRRTEGAVPDRLRRTTLAYEGCGEVTPLDLLEAFGRHFLSWINRWQEEGVEPVQKAWLSRATGLGKRIEIPLGDQTRAGTFEGLTETGALRLVRDGVAQTVALDEAMRAPTWSL